MIVGAIEGSNGGGAITYTLSQHADGVFFAREFIYPAPNALFAILDALIVRRRIQAESEEATRRLKAKIGGKG